MRFIFNTRKSNELSATRRQTVLNDDGRVRFPPVDCQGNCIEKTARLFQLLPSPRAVLTVYPRTAFFHSPERSPAIFFQYF